MYPSIFIQGGTRYMYPSIFIQGGTGYMYPSIFIQGNWIYVPFNLYLVYIEGGGQDMCTPHGHHGYMHHLHSLSFIQKGQGICTPFTLYPLYRGGALYICTPPHIILDTGRGEYVPLHSLTFIQGGGICTPSLFNLYTGGGICTPSLFNLYTGGGNMYPFTL